jgi:hypothetical protein
MKALPKRIFTGFLIYSSISLFVSVISFELFRRMEYTEKLNTHINMLFNKTVHAIKLGQDFMLYEIYQEDFFRSEHSIALDKYEVLLKDIDSIQTNISQIQQIQQTPLAYEVRRLKELMTRYDSLFKIIVRKETLRGFKDYGMEGKMKSNVKELEAEPRINPLHVLMMRKYEKDYLIRGDSSSITDLRILSEKIDEELISSDKLTSMQKKHLREALSNYVSTFMQIVSLEMEIGHQQQIGLSANMKQVVAEVDIAVDTINDLAIQQKEKMNKKIKTIFLIVITVSVLLILLMAVGFKYVTNFET